MNVHDIKWPRRFLDLAYQVASWSKDPSTQVGAVVVDQQGHPMSFGFNGMPKGVDDYDESRNERPTKYFYYEHAERNSIYLARRSLEDCVMVVTHHPCPGCARAIVQSGISHLYIDHKHGAEWSRARDEEAYLASTAILKEGGVEVIFLQRYVHFMHDTEAVERM